MQILLKAVSSVKVNFEVGSEPFNLSVQILSDGKAPGTSNADATQKNNQFCNQSVRDTERDPIVVRRKTYRPHRPRHRESIIPGITPASHKINKSKKTLQSKRVISDNSGNSNRPARRPGRSSQSIYCLRNVIKKPQRLED